MDEFDAIELVIWAVVIIGTIFATLVRRYRTLKIFNSKDLICIACNSSNVVQSEGRVICQECGYDADGTHHELTDGELKALQAEDKGLIL